MLAQFLNEVVSWGDINCKNTVGAFADFLNLSGMKTQRANVWCCLGVDLEADMLWLGQRPVNTKIVPEELLCLEIFRQTVWRVGCAQALDAVERIDTRIALLGMVFGLANHIPPLTENFQAIRSKQERMSFWTVKTVIGDVKLMAVLHRSDDGREVARPLGNLLEDDAAAQVARDVHYVADSKRVYQPREYRTVATTVHRGDGVLTG